MEAEILVVTADGKGVPIRRPWNNAWRSPVRVGRPLAARRTSGAEHVGDDQGLKRVGKIARYGSEIPEDVVAQLRPHAARRKHQNRAASGRLTRERVSRVIAQIGEEAKVVVRQPNKETGRRIKYASAHDLRRSCAERLINLGVSAESLMVIMRHKDFATTRKFYGAKRAAQAAAAEIHQKLVLGERAEELVRDVESLGKFTAEEMKALKRIVKSLRQPVEDEESER